MRPNLIDVGRSKVEMRDPGRQTSTPIARSESFYRATKAEPAYSSAQQIQPAEKRPWRLAPAEGWFALILLAIALYCVVDVIIAANWVRHSSLLLLCPLLGLGVGLLIAKIPRFSQAPLHISACLLGYWFAVWLTSAMAYHIPWTEVLAGLQAAFSGQPVAGVMPASEFVFYFYLVFLCFFLGYFGSWLVYRAHLPWLVALVYCSIMLVNLNYIQRDLTYLMIIMAGTLVLLIARMQLVAKVAQWTSEGLHTDRAWLRTINRRCMQAACVIMVLALLTSWLLPAHSQPASGNTLWKQMGNAWTNVLNGHVSLQNIGSLTSSQPAANFFGDQLTVTGSVQLPNGQVLYYTSSDGQSHYLEGFTYNHFDGHSWTTSLTIGNGYNANTAIPANNDEGPDASQLTTSVTIIQPPGGSKSYLFAPALPVQFSVPTIIYNDGTTGAWTQQDPLTGGETYEVISNIALADAQSLADVALPQADEMQWSSDAYYKQLQQDYLQTPSDLTSNVRTVTKQWTAGANDAYDAMKLLESHLSDATQFRYSLDNPPIPDNMDVVDWLLQNRTGYCTHYATTMALMGRLLGIPTRVVNGFSRGHYDSVHKVWSVDGSDAHSWVQAYFPGHGWISFDPTPGFSLSSTSSTPTTATPPTSRPTPLPTTGPNARKPVPTAQPNHPVAGAHTGQQGTADSNLVTWTIIAVSLLLLSLLLFLWASIRYWWRHLYANSSAVSGMFWRVCRMAGWVGLAPRAWQTPYEYSSMLSQHVPQRAAPLWRLTELFVRDRWGGSRAQSHEEESVERLWPALRAMLLRLYLRKAKK